MEHIDSSPCGPPTDVWPLRPGLVSFLGGAGYIAGRVLDVTAFPRGSFDPPLRLRTGGEIQVLGGEGLGCCIHFFELDELAQGVRSLGADAIQQPTIVAAGVRRVPAILPQSPAAGLA
ncbi:hypothetical protein [Arthrobacter methylotrophus]|uniref:hypothetical protein n=1 Tax=Arthrobacter methylotrophus TaxID=121291 RepID=UPI0031EA1B6C